MTIDEIRELKTQAQADIKSILDKLQEDIELPFSVEVEWKNITMPSPKGFHKTTVFKLFDVEISIEL